MEITPFEKRSTILVIDDEPVARKLLARLLELWGYEVLVAEDGLAGLKMAQTIVPDLILTDALMPGMDGREMCRILKGNPTTKGINVIVTTGLYTSQRYANEAYRTFSVDGYLRKPVNQNELREILGKHLPDPPIANTAEIEPEPVSADE